MVTSVHGSSDSSSTSNMCSSPSTTNAVNSNPLQKDPQPTVASPPTSVVHPQLTASTSSHPTCVISQPTSVVPSQAANVVVSQPANMPPFQASSSCAANEATGAILSPRQEDTQSPDFLSSQSSNSISLLSPQQPRTTLSQSMERFNLGMENNALGQPPTPFHSTSYSAIPSAMNALLEMDYCDIHNEATVSDSDCKDSGLSPNSSTSFNHPMYNITPPNMGLNRSFSLPPRPMWPRVHSKAGSYRFTSSDYVSGLL
jgi:hypothetical protein